MTCSIDVYVQFAFIQTLYARALPYVEADEQEVLAGEHAEIDHCISQQHPCAPVRTMHMETQGLTVHQ